MTLTGTVPFVVPSDFQSMSPSRGSYTEKNNVLFTIAYCDEPVANCDVTQSGNSLISIVPASVPSDFHSSAESLAVYNTTPLTATRGELIRTLVTKLVPLAVPS